MMMRVEPARKQVRGTRMLTTNWNTLSRCVCSTVEVSVPVASSSMLNYPVNLSVLQGE